MGVPVPGSSTKFITPQILVSAFKTLPSPSATSTLPSILQPLFRTLIKCFVKPICENPTLTTSIVTDDASLTITLTHTQNPDTATPFTVLPSLIQTLHPHLCTDATLPDLLHQAHVDFFPTLETLLIQSVILPGVPETVDAFRRFEK
ncbi:hypothetical protein HDU67_001838, partial [Dinochytrium kinnereticum]